MSSLMERAIRGRISLRCAELCVNLKKKKLFLWEETAIFGGRRNDVYNISVLFDWWHPVIIGTRGDARSAGRFTSYVLEEKDGVWIQPTLTDLPLEDGFATQIGNETIIGGVEVYPNVT